MTLLDPSRRTPVRYQMHNGLIVGFSKHAIKRAEERGIDTDELLRSLAGVPLKHYRRRGVVAFRKGTMLKIITVWKPECSHISKLVPGPASSQGHTTTTAA